jgi:RimJ/RimL family protein N-acetyltransferase
MQRACAHWSTRWGVHFLPRPYRLGDATRFIRKSRADFWTRHSIPLAITLDGDTLVGMVALSHLSVGNRVAELGYWIAPGHRRKGYATEAARALCEVGFRTLRLHRIEARAFTRNHASIRVLEKAGLRREGVFHERVRFGGAWLDQIWLARLVNE